MADDILAYDLLKSANLATHEATIPDHQYNIMKDQLKKTISDASWQVPTKTEVINKTEKTFPAEEFNNVEMQHEYLQDTLPSEHEYYPFRDLMNQQLGEEFEHFYNKGNDWNYALKYGHQKRQSHQMLKPINNTCTLQEKTTPSPNLM